jgi:hypothetical protein
MDVSGKCFEAERSSSFLSCKASNVGCNFCFVKVNISFSFSAFDEVIEDE